MRPHPRLAVALLALSLATLTSAEARERTDPNEPNPPPDPALTRAAIAPKRSFVVPSRSTNRPATGAEGDRPGGGWWLGPSGVVVALAAVGALSWGAQRFRLDLGKTSARGPSRLAVVGSVRLGGKQALHLVRVGDRVLIVGTGPGSSPQSLGEVTDPAELARLAPHRTNPIASPAAPTSRATSTSARPRTRLDQRIGDDE